MVLTQRWSSGSSEGVNDKFPYHYGSYATLFWTSWLPSQSCVSIPLWFLRNRGLLLIRRTSLSFHTTMVLTQRFIPVYNYITNKRFHTTMVLTQRRNMSLGVHLGDVSIPLWFLRNKVRKKQRGAESQFPYHYGSYATVWRFKWFGSNPQVSIPLWFLRNAKCVLSELISNAFPYHYGSYATSWNRTKISVSNSKFPYHYGSYATNRGGVSNSMLLIRFHTTMVLTQLAEAIGCSVSCF